MPPSTRHAHADPTPSGIKQRIPNLLTIGRVILALVFFGMLTPYRWAAGDETTGPDLWLLAAAACFIVAAISDALDGYLARSWGVVSLFGRVMDPFADKLLVIGAFVFLASPAFAADGRQVSGVQAWMVAVILARELLVTSLRGVMESAGVAFPATWSGKAKMILQSICIPVVLAALAFAKSADEPIVRGAHILVWVTVVVTVWSGLPYILQARAASRE